MIPSTVSEATRSRFGHRIALSALWCAVSLWTVVLGRLVVMRHEKFGTFDFDLGIHDQAIWLLARGESFNTVRGMASLGHHATFSYFLLSPLSWLGAGPNTWNVLQCFALAVSAIPLYLIARNRFDKPIACLAVGVGWLLQPWLSWFAQETFHPEVMAMPFLLWGFLLVDPAVHSDTSGRPNRRDVTALALFVVAMGWKEDVALAVMMLGFGLLFTPRRSMARWLIGVGASWFVLFGAWLVPMWAGGTATYGGIYGELGESGLDILLNSVANPDLVWDRFIVNEGLLYAAKLFLPFGLLALASPRFLLMMVPQYFANILTTVDFTHQPRFHYSAIPMVALAVATVDGIHVLRRTKPIRWIGVLPLVTLLFAASVIGARERGILPFAEQYSKGAWPLAPRDTSGWEAAIERVGPTDGVASHYLGVPHLSQRRQVYTFPNPWENSYFGTSPDDRGDPSSVEWIIVLEGGMNDLARDTLQRLVSSGEFGDARRVDDVVTYRRLRTEGD